MSPNVEMDAPTEQPTETIRRLERRINDLVSILALPAIWTGNEPTQLADVLIDSLQGMLRLELAYVRLNGATGEPLYELARLNALREAGSGPGQVGRMLNEWLGNEPENWPSQVTKPYRDGLLCVVPLRLGLNGEMGVMVVGSTRSGFPDQTESLLLSVAANQAAIGLQGARLLSEQGRLAGELDQRVAERTRDLAAANDELRLQVGLLQRLPVAAWTLTPDGIPDFVNESWLRYAGQTLDQIRSHPEAWMAVVHPDDRDRTSMSYWEGIRSGRGFTTEARFRRASDGSYRWHLNHAVALRDDLGKVLRFIGTSTDIEDQKQTQEDLQRAEERTTLIIDTALDAVVTMSAEGTITSWNEQAATMFGWRSDEAIGNRMSEMIIPEQHRPAHERGLRHFLNTGEGPLLRRRIQVPAIRRGGLEFPVELQVVPMRLGREWVFSAFIRDITESKRAEDKLRESEFSLRQLTETIPEMLWSATPAGSIDYCNARVLDYTGSSAAGLMGDGWKRLLHPDDANHAAGVWMACVTSGSQYRVEVRIFHAADRAWRWCVISALPLQDDQGRILKWHGTVVDMHDWRQAQEELRNTQAELAYMTRVTTMGALTASIAHEVNQPLAGIVTNANTCLRMLAADPPNVVGARETARRTIRDGNRASDVITRLRSLFSRKEPTKEPVNLNEATREVLALSRTQLQKSQVVLEFFDDLPLITGDRIQLQQVILNLILNAADAMNDVDGRPRWLVIRTGPEEDDRVRVTVKDSGTGLGPQGAERLFQPFYTTKSGGMGIGLAVSRSIIESHGGRLWAEPNDEFGATFAFSIPIHPVPRQMPMGLASLGTATRGDPA
jgi:PAS domain S-box-containing protein